VVPGFSGRLRVVRALYRSDDAPELGATSHLSGAELRRARKSGGLTLRELGGLVGVPAWTVQSWENRGDRSIPLWSVEAVRRAIENASPLEQRNRQAVVKLISARAGIAKSSVPRKLHDAVDSLLDNGDVRLAATWDSLGRPYRGLFLAGDAAPRRVSMTAQELAERREGARVSQQELADRVGVRASAVSRWESGVRGIPPARVATVRSALDELSASTPPGRRLRRPRTEPGPDAPESARALRRRRISAGLSQVDLACSLGISSAAVSHWERTGLPRSRAAAVDVALADGRS
jgi:transcriptional regulator with XRE-family HTH domain